MRSNDVIGKQNRQSGSPHHWSWIGFACGFVLFGIVVFFNATMPFAERFWPHVIETLVFATVCGVFIGRFGDVAFVKILSILRWF